MAPSVAPSYFTSGLGAPPSLTAVGLSAWLLLDVEYPHLHGGEGAGEWVLRIPLRRGGVLLGILCVFFWDKCRSFSTLFFRSPRTPPLHGTPEVDVYPPPLKPPARGPLRFGPPRPAPRCGPRGVPLHHRRRRRRPRPRLPPPGPHMIYPHTGIFPFCFLPPRPKIQDLFFPLSSFSRFHL